MHLSGNLYYIIAQVIGFGAMALGITSFQAKKRSKILIMQVLMGALWTVQFVMLGAVTGAVLNGISVFRNFLFVFKGKYKWASSKLLPLSVMAAFLLAGIFTYQGFISILPTVAMLISTAALFLSDEKKIRILSLFVSPLWLIYDVVEKSISGSFMEVFTIISILIALWRFRNRKVKEN